MHSFAEILTTNPSVIALANLSGLVGLLLLIMGSVRSIYKFSVNAWHSSVKSAARQVRRRYIYILMGSALDLHSYISRLVLLLGGIVVSYSGVTVFGVVAILDKKSSGPAYLMLLYGALGMMLAFALVYYILGVSRVRRRMLARRMSARKNNGDQPAARQKSIAAPSTKR